MNILEMISEYWNILSLAVTVLVGFVLWHMSQRFVSRAEFDTTIENMNKLQARQEETITGLATTILKLDTTITNMPTATSLHRLELGLEELRGLQKESAAQMKGQLAAMERLNNNFDRLALKRGE